jgi:hypothetical protein
MKRRLETAVLVGALLGASAGFVSAATENIQVKQMTVNGVELAYVEEGRGDTVVCSFTARSATGAIGSACDRLSRHSTVSSP